eukprot:gene8486-4846_t
MLGSLENEEEMMAAFTLFETLSSVLDKYNSAVAIAESATGVPPPQPMLQGAYHEATSPDRLPVSSQVFSVSRPSEEGATPARYTPPAHDDWAPLEAAPVHAASPRLGASNSQHAFPTLAPPPPSSGGASRAMVDSQPALIDLSDDGPPPPSTFPPATQANRPPPPPDDSLL